MSVVNSIVRQVWKYVDTNGAILTGLGGGDFTFALKRSTSAGTVTATETVSVVETADPGFYDISYTPLQGGVYTLYLDELNAGSNKRSWWFVSEVSAVGAVFAPAFANSFCAETDVERWTQLQFNATSKPTTDQVAAFAQGRASEIQLRMAAAGWLITPSSVSDQVQIDNLRELNAIGAAADAMQSKFMDTDPARTLKADELLTEYGNRMAALVENAKMYLATSRFIGSSIESGEVTPAQETQITDGGLKLGISMDQEF